MPSVSAPLRLDRRLPFLARLINGGVGALRKLGLPLGDLDPGRLRRNAQKAAGVYDVDDSAVNLPLGKLVESLESEGDLTAIGRLMAREYLGRSLANRLLVADERRRYPETAQLSIPRPLYVVGPPRTGTTLLFNLLAQDPQIGRAHV